MAGFVVHYKSRQKMRERRRPAWLRLLLGMKFFEICGEHRHLHKSEQNIYCVDCNCCMCSHCLAAPPGAAHRRHQVLQIRRYVYQDVIRIHDIQKLIDCSKVQPYTVNSAKVVLLKPRRQQSRPSKVNASGSACEICGRGINEPNRFCSIACKVSEEDVELSVSDVENGMAGCNSLEAFDSPAPSDHEADSRGGDESSSCLLSPLPSVSGEENRNRRISTALNPRRTIGRKKSVPKRAPIF